MATYPVKLFGNVALTAAFQTLYTVPDNRTTKLYEIVLCNSHTADVGIILHLVPYGGTETDANKILDGAGYFVESKKTRLFACEQRLEGGTTIRAKATVAGVVSAHGAGDEVTK